MTKPKKKKRSLVATDTMWDLVKNAADKAEMSHNEWVLAAISQALQNGVHGEGGIDIEKAAEFAFANAIEKGCESIGLLLTKLDSNKTFWQREMNKCNLVSEELRLEKKLD